MLSRLLSRLSSTQCKLHASRFKVQTYQCGPWSGNRSKRPASKWQRFNSRHLSWSWFQPESLTTPPSYLITLVTCHKTKLFISMKPCMLRLECHPTFCTTSSTRSSGLSILKDLRISTYKLVRFHWRLLQVPSSPNWMRGGSWKGHKANDSCFVNQQSGFTWFFTFGPSCCGKPCMTGSSWKADATFGDEGLSKERPRNMATLEHPEISRSAWRMMEYNICGSGWSWQ